MSVHVFLDDHVGVDRLELLALSTDSMMRTERASTIAESISLIVAGCVLFLIQIIKGANCHLFFVQFKFSQVVL